MAETTHKLLKRFKRQFITTNMLFALVVLVTMSVAVLSFQNKQHYDEINDALSARINMSGRLGMEDLEYANGFVSSTSTGQAKGSAGAANTQNAASSTGGTASPGAADADSSTGSTGSASSTGEESQPPAPAQGGAQNQAQGPAQGDSAAPAEVVHGPTGALGAEPNGGHFNRREMNDDQFIATALYLVKADGTVASGHNDAFSIDDDMLADAVSEAISNEGADDEVGARGYIPDLHLFYQVRHTYNDNYVLAFASDKYILQDLFNLALQLALLSLLALMAFGLLSFLLSRWISRPVENAWVQQQQFIADASHELKTPLTVITANDSILLSQPEATIASQRQWIESTETEARLMQEVINDMLYLAKADAEKLPLEYGQVDFSEILTLQLLQFESVAFERGAEFTSNVQDGVKLYGDAARLQRLTGILLDNACKYVDEDGKIEVILRAAEKVCILRVRNTGAVIDEQDIPHLFDRFFRSDKARTRGAGGVGLGLAIAKSIVDDHKGSIRVASAPEIGTTFTVELPLLR